MHFHKWGKWALYEMKGTDYTSPKAPFVFSETRQRRTCEKCGLVEDKHVAQGAAINIHRDDSHAR